MDGGLGGQINREGVGDAIMNEHRYDTSQAVSLVCPTQNTRKAMREDGGGAGGGEAGEGSGRRLRSKRCFRDSE